MDELLTEFLTETNESLAVIDAELVQFEQNPGDLKILGNIFRLVHTIKGTCGFLGLGRLEAIAHAGETLLGLFRDKKLSVSAPAVTAILKCIDAIRGILAELEQSGAEPAGDDSALIKELGAIAAGSPPSSPAAADASTPEVRPAAAASESAIPLAEGGFPVAAELLEEVARAEASGIHAASDADIAAAIAAERAREAAAAMGTAMAAPAVAAEAPQAAAETAGAASKERDSAVANQSIRVAVDTLETLMTLVSELVLTRNQLLQMVRNREDTGLAAPLQRLSHLTTELQEGVMKTRMQPIGNAWAKLPRIVRDLSVETGKKLELTMIGAETELDRQVLQLIKDPLTHMVRNSADHGIETPEERRAHGKPEMGTITLKAYHEGGHIIIEVADDGRGLDVDRIRRKILAQGLASPSELVRLTDEQVYQFIFRAGFSTAEKVTNVSGRGVGMDVVRTNVEKIGGTIALKALPQRGTTFTIKIPLTLAIVSALILGCAGQRFAVPQICVRELVRVAGDSENRIERINNAPLLRLRERLLPLIDLRALLRLESAAANESEPFVVVTQVGTVSFGIIVDEVFDTEEIVVKPVASILRTIPYYAGNTILGDGSVIMILDPNGIAATVADKTAQSAEESEASGAKDQEKTRMLVFRAGDADPKAVPLELIARLEQIEAAKIERSQGRAVIQYRNSLMPLVPLADSFDWACRPVHPVLVFSDRDRSMGLVVDEIIDVLEETLTIEIAAEKEGILGSAVIGGRSTDIIDVTHFLTKAYPGWFGAEAADVVGTASAKKKLLVVEDSDFFRALLVPILEAAGYAVTAVANAAQALRIRDAGQRFDAIISDIEMPGLNGFEFAENVRRDDRWCQTPLVALSSYASQADFARGRAVGFTDYVAKFDREGLMQSLAQTLGRGPNGWRGESGGLRN
jgi:two-component system chemotaxis sensor kinase CheA